MILIIKTNTKVLSSIKKLFLTTSQVKSYVKYSRNLQSQSKIKGFSKN